MAYRDERRCYLCGALTRDLCPRCENAVCSEHTLASRLEGASAAERAEGERLGRRLGGLGACSRCVEREVEASRGPFVEIMRSGDPIQTQMVVEALADAGFDARAIGTQNAALLGAGQHILEQRVEVPRPQVEAALELVQTLQGGGPAEGDGPAGGDESDEGDGEEPRPLSPRRPAIAAGLAFIFPGASHYYCRQPLIGMLLTVSFFLGLARLAQQATLVGAALMLTSVALDVVGGQLAIPACNRGQPRSSAMQLVHVAWMAALLSLLGMLVPLLAS